VKVNMVVKRGVSGGQRLADGPPLPRARSHSSAHRVHGRRPLERLAARRRGPAAEIVAAIDAELAIEPAEPNYRGEVARRWRYRDGSGEIGVIASVAQPFCGDCTAPRLSAEGRLYTCLFGMRGHDLRAVVRGGVTDEELSAEIGRCGAGAPTGTPRSAPRTRSTCRSRNELHRGMNPDPVRRYYARALRILCHDRFRRSRP
jgi:cyclic pyranopterin phosphate synthase